MISFDEIRDQISKVIERLEGIPEDGDLDTLIEGINEALQLAYDLRYETDKEPKLIYV
jgi:hypothetical protein